MTVGDLVGEALQDRGAKFHEHLSRHARYSGSQPIFSCRIPATLQAEVRAYASEHRMTVTAVVAGAVEFYFLAQGGGMDVRPIPHLHQKEGGDEVQDLFVIEGLDAA